MAHSTLRGVLFLSTLTFVACKGGDPKTGTCEQIVGCGCSAPKYASVDECVAAIDTAVDAARESAQIEGLQFDEDCYQVLLGRIEDNVMCKTASEVEVSDLLGCPYCTAVYGDKPIGGTCTSYQYGSDCASGLVCIANNGSTGTCVSLCNFLAAGEVCVREESGQTFLDQCEEGLRCDLTSKTCAPRLANGGGCDSDDDCVSDYCDSAMTCTPARGEGEACDAGRCGEFLVCEADACVRGPVANQPCPIGVCAEGATCEDGTCVLEEPLVCEIEFEQTP